MSRIILAAVILLGRQLTGMAEITPMFNATGTPILERLLVGTEFDLTDIDLDRIEYVGGIDAGQAQAGLFDELVLHGQNDTTLSLGPGVVLTSGFVTGLPTTNTSGSYSNVTNTGGNNYFPEPKECVLVLSLGICCMMPRRQYGSRRD